MYMGNCSKCGYLPLLSAEPHKIKYTERGMVKEVSVLFVYCSKSGCGQPYGVVPAPA
jgi:hypothetical protein